MSTPTFGSSRAAFVDPENGQLSRDALKKLQEWEAKLNQTLTLFGEIADATKIQGRSEGIGTTVSKLNSAGNVKSLLNVIADRTLANVADDAGSDRRAATANQKTGGDRGFGALDVNNRLQNSFRANGVNLSNAPTAATTMTNDGIATAIVIAANTSQFAPGTIAYNSGSVDPGSFAKAFVYFDDPTFAGGAVVYASSTNAQAQVAAEGRQQMGPFTTTGGAPKTGGGLTGGTGGTKGGRGFAS